MVADVGVEGDLTVEVFGLGFGLGSIDDVLDFLWVYNTFDYDQYGLILKTVKMQNYLLKNP